MTNTLSKFLAASFMALAFAAVPATSFAQAAMPGAQAAPSAASVQAFFTELKLKLKISGPAQEKGWVGFMKGSEQRVDMSTFQDINSAKTTPELMNSLEKMQTQASSRFLEQKKAIVGLYDVLDAEQRKTFDVFVFSTMARMGAPAQR